MFRSPVRAIAVSLALACAFASAASAQNSTAPGATRVYSTIYSIGVEWDIAGDADHDAVASVDYRVQGASTWTPALPLVRVDYNGGNMLAGSVLDLAPGSPFELRLSLADHDGGAETRLLAIATWPLPALPAAGRTFHVAPGAGGGDGSQANPFGGIAAAQAVALPGDTFLIHAGNYGGRVRFTKAGAESNYLVWKAAGDGEVSMNGIDVAASYVWLEGLTVRGQANALVSVSAPTAVVVRGCTFSNNHYSVYLQGGGDHWYIADNTIAGDTPYATESFDGEGIELNSTSGHTVAHNSVTNVADGISYPLRNVDIFGNDIFDTSDDGIEGDYGYANVRIWGNRIHNAVHNGISFQPQNGAPWYILRNQIVSNVEGAFKFRTTDRFVLLHNTIVNWGTAWPGDALMCCNEDHLMRGLVRNNLWISVQGGQLWGFDAFTRDWRTDLDRDGFDWGAAVNPFSYGGATYPDLAGFSAASGLEAGGVRVSKDDCFETFDVPNPPKNPVPAQTMTLTAACGAVDAGAVLANVNDGRYEGAGPDLGAYERGRPAPAFGPRSMPTARLSALPGSVALGDSTALSWTTTDATTVTIDQGIGSVVGTGWRAVSPAVTTTYTLIAVGPAGTATDRITVKVGAAAAPAAPSSLAARALSSTSVALSWTDNSGNESGFVVERSVGGAGFVPLATLSANVTAYTDTMLSPGTAASYRVSSYNTAGSSPYSNVATVTTMADVLAAPTALAAAAAGARQINLAWTDNSSAETGFRIERSTNGSSFTEIATVGANVGTYADRKVTGGKTYSYRVRAYGATGTSAYSNVASATTPRK